MGFLDLLFGGGAEGASDALQQGYQEAQGYQQPYYQGGQRAMGNLENFLAPMQNPTSYYDQLMKSYQPSAAFNMKKNRILEMLGNNAAVTGRFGTPAQSREEADYITDLLNSDSQNYLNNIFGIGDRYQSGQGGLYQGGVTAAGNLSNLAMQRAQAQAQAEMANSNKWTGLLGMAGNLGANYLTGGWGSVLEPFTSRGQAGLSWLSHGGPNQLRQNAPSYNQSPYQYF